MELHRGVNINVREGTEVQSVMDGTVVRTGYNSAFGNYVVTQDEKGVQVKYANLQNVSVSQGEVVTKDTVIGDILDICPDAAPYFLQMGMHCLGCPASRGETVEQACAVHGVDTDDLLEQINALIRK